jgi:uncharacterized membrane protein YuzA (DUF378 family)
MCNGKDCCKGCCTLAFIGKILLIIGGINWGLIGIGMLMGGDWNVVKIVLGNGNLPTLEAIVYILVGVAALFKIFGCKCRKCMTSCASCNTGSVDEKM